MASTAVGEPVLGCLMPVAECLFSLLSQQAVENPFLLNLADLVTSGETESVTSQGLRTQHNCHLASLLPLSCLSLGVGYNLEELRHYK